MGLSLSTGLGLTALRGAAAAAQATLARAVASMRHISDAETASDGLSYTGFDGTPTITYYANGSETTGGAARTVGDTVYAVVAGTDDFGNSVSLTTQTITVKDQITTTNATSFTFSGDTNPWTWDTSLPHGTFAMGDPFILSTSAANVTAYGDSDGVMENPDMSGGEQGFGSHITRTTYNAALNKVSASFALSLGASTTLVGGIHQDSAVHADNVNNSMERYSPFTILAAAPPEGAFRPPMHGVSKTTVVTVDDIDLSSCRSLDISGITGLATYADTLAKWRSPLALFSRWGEQLREIEVLNHVDSSNYSSYVARMLLHETLLYLHSNSITDSQKTELAKFIIQAAIDMKGVIDAGNYGARGAGQWEFYCYLLYISAALTGNAQFVEASRLFNGNIEQMQWVDAGDVGQAPLWGTANASSQYQYVRPITEEHLNTPLWGSEKVGPAPDKSVIFFRTYMGSSTEGRFATVPAIWGFQATDYIPSGEMLLTYGYDPDSTDHDRTSVTHFIDREGTLSPHETPGGATYITAKMQETYEMFRPFATAANRMLTEPPMVPIPFDVTEASGTVSWDMSTPISNQYGSGLPITGMTVYHSLDGVQFEQVSTDTAGSHSAILGISNYYSASLTNANGEGERSWTDKDFKADALGRNEVVPSGTATGTVSNTATPKLYVQKTGAGLAYVFDEATDGVELGRPIYIGWGMWTGAISGTPTVTVEKWDGSSWASATGTLAREDHQHGTANGAWIYVPALADDGAQIRSKIVWGGVTAYSDSLTLGSLAALDAGVVAEYDGNYSSNTRYENFLSEMETNATNCVFDPRPNIQVVDENDNLLTTGCIKLDKTGAYPYTSGQLATGLTIGADYNFEVHMISDYDGVPFTAGTRVRLSSDNTNQGEYLNEVGPYDGTVNRNDHPTAGTPGTFTALTADLYFYFIQTTGTGGTTGGDPVLAYIKVWEA